MTIMKRFSGKTVVVTGGGRGIGFGIAERFAEEGANLVLAGRDPRVEEAAEEIKSFGGAALGVACDVTNKAEALGTHSEDPFIVCITCTLALL
jgi:meso-butanediol dehydrogenase/(S,S)-butanediol dehydrogenase/diacetyl reductase